MSGTFSRQDIKYKPKEILNEKTNSLYSSTSRVSSDIVQEESLKVADRLIEHLSLIKEYQERLNTIDYLSDNASNLAQGLSYSTDDEDIKSAIIAYGETGNVVTFAMFKKAINDIIENYNNVVITSLAGIKL